ncbi:hypothetical protein HCN51_31695 [Nonomuraea sp. FMUSA5-5]|uniref:Uncharacterized protein n=1 Tax=Nonomuraea composti TaxID=2720023 RepID=A0ABX1BDX7_9ACTN|nr:hypothetical protein [Nonomuraea sp. FMUSA5-5]NJP93949.1 hypothetical protein [Nonomuraea sp. FMUSA5-5]
MAAQTPTLDGAGIVDAIITAAGEFSADQAEADTMANATITFLAGHWRTPVAPAAPLIRLQEWAATCAPEDVRAILGNAAAEADWLAGYRDVQPELLSPLEMAEQAKRQRDLVGELGALTSGYEALTSAPWYPAQAGDIVHVFYWGSFTEAIPAQGETYVVEHSEAEGGLVLRVLHADEHLVAPGCFAPGTVDDPLIEAWMEAGPAALTIVRAGRVIHGTGAAQ